MTRPQRFPVYPVPGIQRARVVSNDDARLAALSSEAPRIPWHEFIGREFIWLAGEHVGLIGPTGQGKTTLLVNILPMHRYVTAFATKPRDRTMQGLIDQGYLKLERWRSIDPDIYPRRVIWPNARRLNSRALQKQVFADAFEKIYLEGNWTVAIDETWWFSEILHMDEYIKTYLLQARSLGISLVAGTQRPAWVPREIYTSCTHLFFWRVNDATDLQNLSGIGWRSSDLIREAVANLDPYQCLYVNTRTGKMARTRAPRVSIA